MQLPKISISTNTSVLSASSSIVSYYSTYDVICISPTSPVPSMEPLSHNKEL